MPVFIYENGFVLSGLRLGVGRWGLHRGRGGERLFLHQQQEFDGALDLSGEAADIALDQRQRIGFSETCDDSEGAAVVLGRVGPILIDVLLVQLDLQAEEGGFLGPSEVEALGAPGNLSDDVEFGLIARGEVGFVLSEQFLEGGFVFHCDGDGFREATMVVGRGTWLRWRARIPGGAGWSGSLIWA
jgi:hypothetical protein